MVALSKGLSPVGSIGKWIPTIAVTGTGYWFRFWVSFDTHYVLCLVSSIV